MPSLRLSFTKMVQYDNKEKGAGYKLDGTECLRCWENDISGLDAVIEADEGALWDYLASQTDLLLEMFGIFEDGRLTGNRQEDADGYPVDDSYEGQLYLVDYDIYVEELRTPTVEELQKLFPSLEMR